MSSVLIALIVATPAIADAESPPNVLFIAVDDLRPELRCNGYPHMVTPNLDRLARQGRLFSHHYVQVPTCGASRFSMLTGLRPSRTGALNNAALGRLSSEPAELPQTLPECFRRQGYKTVCIGKISHQPDGRVYQYDGSGDGHQEVPFAWDELATPLGKWQTGWNAFFGYASGIGRESHPHPPPFEAAAVADDGYPDGLIADRAVQKLNELRDQPFFLAVGFYKPHLPFNAPQKYWDLYPAETIPLSESPEKPSGINPKSWHGSGEMFGRYRHAVKRPIGPEYARQLRRAYFASVSYVDAQIGKVLSELDRLSLAENTIVVVWGDHGWHLGDHAIWGKHTCFERSLRSVLVMRLPKMVSPGQETSGIVESLDIYPTLVDLCDIKLLLRLDGVSLRPLLEDPAHTGKTAAFGYWTADRRTLRTDRWRITEYPRATAAEIAVELYDHASDPGETTNVAQQHPFVVAELLKRLRSDTSTLPE